MGTVCKIGNIQVYPKYSKVQNALKITCILDQGTGASSRATPIQEKFEVAQQLSKNWEDSDVEAPNLRTVKEPTNQKGLLTL